MPLSCLGRTASLAEVFLFLPSTDGGIDIHGSEVMYMRLCDGHLIYLAVGPPTQALAELFVNDPGHALTPRARRAWRRTLSREVRVFQSLSGCTDPLLFLDTVQFPVALVEVEE